MNKILNLYCGIGGNRSLWGNNIDVVAIENNPDIANVYKCLYPRDTVIIGDAHEYLIDNFKSFDFIWSSPPCTTHSKMRLLNVGRGVSKHLYVDMRLYQEILLLKNFSKCPWVIENVNPYYTPLIKPNYNIGRHSFWCDFKIHDFKNIENKGSNIKRGNVDDLQNYLNIDISRFIISNKRSLLRNCVHPSIGLHIIKSVINT